MRRQVGVEPDPHATAVPRLCWPHLTGRVPVTASRFCRYPSRSTYLDLPYPVIRWREYSLAGQAHKERSPHSDRPAMDDIRKRGM